MQTTARLQQLLDRLRDGEADARDALLGLSLERVRLLARRMFRLEHALRAEAQTDDVVSQAVLRLHRALCEVRPPTVRDFIGLAAQHVRWALRDMARGKAARSRVVYRAEPPEPAAAADGPADLAEWTELHERAGELPGPERAVFDAVFYQGLDQPEAAEALGLPLRTLKRRWRRAKLLLAGALGGPGPGGGA